MVDTGDTRGDETQGRALVERLLSPLVPADVRPCLVALTDCELGDLFLAHRAHLAEQSDHIGLFASVVTSWFGSLVDDYLRRECLLLESDRMTGEAIAEAFLSAVIGDQKGKLEDWAPGIVHAYLELRRHDPSASLYPIASARTPADRRRSSIASLINTSDATSRKLLYLSLVERRSIRQIVLATGWSSQKIEHVLASMICAIVDATDHTAPRAQPCDRSQSDSSQSMEGDLP